MYSTILLDLDHTLLDTDLSTARAFHQVMRSIGFEDPSLHHNTYEEINLKLWRQVEAGTLDPNVLHPLRFELFGAAIGIEVDAEMMADCYAKGMGAYGDLYPGVRGVLEALTRDASLSLVTNGLSSIQRDRVARLELDQYFDAIVISGEVGTSKPGTEIFEITLDRLGNPAREKTLMVGDNLGSDIQGGINFGIDTAWFNPNGAVNSSKVSATYEISNLKDIYRLVETN